VTLPDPVPGLVIRYSFLWSHEAARGQREGTKARPCAIIVAAQEDETGKVRVTVAPITHASPRDETLGVPVPAPVAKRLGFDDDGQWVRFDEINHFEWPGFDLHPLPGPSSDYAYGFLPETLFNKIRNLIFENAKARKIKSILNRDE